MTIMKGLRGLLACLLRAEASRYFTITIKHQPWLGLAGPGHTRTEELRVVTIPVCCWWLGARMTETNKQIPEPGDRDMEDVSSQLLRVPTFLALATPWYPEHSYQ